MNLLLNQEQFGNAQQAVEAAVALRPGSARARRLMIAAELAQQRYGDALKLALERRPIFPTSRR